MHQPLYLDPATGKAAMPWVRLHGARSYLDVAYLLDEYDEVRLTINFVPSLIAQLEAVVGGARDRYQELAEQPGWSLDERVFLLSQFFSVNWGRSVEPRPRYRELLEKRGREVPPGEITRRAASFTDGELRDLTVLFHLAWMGFAAREGDKDLAELERKGRGYDDGDLRLVLERGRAACGRVLPLYRKLAERGQVELVASPYYHPIVPLLVDTQAAHRSQPQLPLPERYAAPDDARVQIARGRDAHARTFGKPPRGMWPPEGSVSPEALAAYREEGIQWLATDEGNLWRSLDGEHPRGELYQAWHHQGIDLVFRDRELSDRVSFSYAFGETRASVEDLLGRARQAASIAVAPPGQPGAPPLVPVILDGENPWEAYPSLGEPFLRALFGGLTTSEDLRAVSIGEHLATVQTRAVLDRMHSGSWIDSDFHIWIGDPVKNRAWDLLGRARRRYARALGEGLGAEASAQALEHLLAAEGSDWFWWFGEPFHTAEKGLFDDLFRAHLRATWSALGDAPPTELAEPVDTGRATAGVQAPRDLVRPVVDGRRTDYYEWVEAGRVELPRSSNAAMADTPIAAALHFGFDEAALFLRLDPADGALGRMGRAAVELALRSDGREVTLRAEATASGAVRPLSVVGMSPPPAERGSAPAAGDAKDTPIGELRALGAIACVEILELEVPLAPLGFRPGTKLEVALRLVDGAVQVGRYPSSGYLSMQVPDEGFAADHWTV
jgi:alpha-amylase/alpha-mannosidase (GH57 family)